MSNANQPAFPVDRQFQNTAETIGLTKRELVAAMAMQTFIQIKGLSTFDAVKNTEGLRDDVIDASFAMADSFLSKPTTNE